MMNNKVIHAHQTVHTDFFLKSFGLNVSLLTNFHKFSKNPMSKYYINLNFDELASSYYKEKNFCCH